VVFARRDRAEIYEREAIMTSLVETPIHYDGIITFETVAGVPDVYEVLTWNGSRD